MLFKHFNMKEAKDINFPFTFLCFKVNIGLKIYTYTAVIEKLF